MNLKSLILNTLLNSFMPKVKVALAGIGNCASALIQGLVYYRQNPEETVGLVDYSIGGIEPKDIEFVAAFEIVILVLETTAATVVDAGIFAPETVMPTMTLPIAVA